MHFLSQPIARLTGCHLCFVWILVLAGCGGSQPQVDEPTVATDSEGEPQENREEKLKRYLAVVLGGMDEGSMISGELLKNGGSDALFEVQTKQQAVINASYNDRIPRFLDLCRYLNDLQCSGVEYELRETIPLENALKHLGTPDSQQGGDYQFQYLTLRVIGDQISKFHVDIPQCVQAFEQESVQPM